eukprot:4358926-Prymnesium_polylepis.1
MRASRYRSACVVASSATREPPVAAEVAEVVRLSAVCGGCDNAPAEQQQHVRVVWGSAPRAPGGSCGFRTSITCNFRASGRTLL